MQRYGLIHGVVLYKVLAPRASATSLRQQSVTEIATDVGVSRSTFQYRLNRAEAWLAQQFAADSLDVDLDVDLDPADIEFIQ